MKFINLYVFIILGINTSVAQAERNSLPIPSKEKLENLVYKHELQNSPTFSLSEDDSEFAFVTDEELKEAELALLNLETICGANNLEYLQKYKGNSIFTKLTANKLAKSVGLLQWKHGLASKYYFPSGDPGNVAGSKWCSGFLVGPDLFATAGHCFDQIPKNGWQLPKIKNASDKYSTISSGEIAKNMIVQFDYLSTPLNPNNVTSYDVKSLKVYRPDGNDFALLEISPRNDMKKNLSKVITNVNYKDQDIISVIQHPNGDAKKIAFGKIDKSLFSNFIKYNDLDTLSGSSGSPVFNIKGEVIGVHIAGNCTSEGTGTNLALPIKKVINLFPES